MQQPFRNPHFRKTGSSQRQLQRHAAAAATGQAAPKASAATHLRLLIHQHAVLQPTLSWPQHGAPRCRLAQLQLPAAGDSGNSCTERSCWSAGCSRRCSCLAATARTSTDALQRYTGRALAAAALRSFSRRNLPPESPRFSTCAAGNQAAALHAQQRAGSGPDPSLEQIQARCNAAGSKCNVTHASSSAANTINHASPGNCQGTAATAHLLTSLQRTAAASTTPLPPCIAWGHPHADEISECSIQQAGTQQHAATVQAPRLLKGT